MILLSHFHDGYSDVPSYESAERNGGKETSKQIDAEKANGVVRSVSMGTSKAIVEEKENAREVENGMASA